MEHNIDARYVTLLDVAEELAETNAELTEVRARMFRAAKIVEAAKKLVTEWYNNPWSSEDVFDAGQELIAVTKQYAMKGVTLLPRPKPHGVVEFTHKKVIVGGRWKGND